MQDLGTLGGPAELRAGHQRVGAGHGRGGHHDGRSRITPSSGTARRCRIWARWAGPRVGGWPSTRRGRSREMRHTTNDAALARLPLGRHGDAGPGHAGRDTQLRDRHQRLWTGHGPSKHPQRCGVGTPSSGTAQRCRTWARWAGRRASGEPSTRRGRSRATLRTNQLGTHAFLWDGTAMHDLNALIRLSDPLKPYVTLY